LAGFQRDLRKRRHFRHNRRGGLERTGLNMGWTAHVTLAIIVLLVLGACVLGFYESTRPPPPHLYQQDVPMSGSPASP